MFDVGFTEVLVIGVIALMVVGPERLPKLARQAGFWVGRARRMVSDVKADIDREIKRADMADDFKDVKNVIHDAKSDIDSATTDMAETITNYSSTVEKEAEAIVEDVNDRSTARSTATMKADSATIGTGQDGTPANAKSSSSHSSSKPVSSDSEAKSE